MDPYKVLGINEDADEETIKKAYKTLVKKYHPDRYVNNPLADLAAEKMKEINEAYDVLVKNKNRPSANSSSGGRYSQGGYSQSGTYQNAVPTFALVRQLLAAHSTVQALMVLSQLPKTAEWFYLSGVADMQRGWYSQSLRNFETAVKMEPDNEEYKTMLNNIKSNTQSYNTENGTYQTTSDCCGSCPCWCIPCLCPGCGCC